MKFRYLNDNGEIHSADLEWLLDLDRKCFDGLSLWGGDVWTGWAKNKDVIMIAIQDEEQSDIGVLVVNDFSPDDNRILKICIDPEKRRQGLARRVLERLQLFAVQEGISTLSLEVEQSNEAAMALYEGLDYKIVGTRTNYYGEGKHGYLMELDVQNAGIRRRNDDLPEGESLLTTE